jgi:aspartate racemase
MQTRTGVRRTLPTAAAPACIGVLGGTGPAATVHVHRLLVTEAQRRYDAVQDADFPSIVVMNTPIADVDQMGFHERAALSIARSLGSTVELMAAAGAAVILPACNTLDLLRASLCQPGRPPLLSLPQLVALRARERGYDRVGVLTSRTSRDRCLYASALTAVGIACHALSEEDQHTVDSLILKAMAGVNDATDLDQTNDIAERLVSGGADAVVVGCTELSMIAADGLAAHALDSAVEGVSRALQIAYRQGT